MRFCCKNMYDFLFIHYSLTKGKKQCTNMKQCKIRIDLFPHKIVPVVERDMNMFDPSLFSSFFYTSHSSKHLKSTFSPLLRSFLASHIVPKSIQPNKRLSAFYFSLHTHMREFMSRQQFSIDLMHKQRKYTTSRLEVSRMNYIQQQGCNRVDSDQIQDILASKLIKFDWFSSYFANKKFH